MNSRIALLTVAATAFGLTTVAQTPSPDWPQWRGANRDGAAQAAAPKAWPDQLTLAWRVPVGLGYAAPIIVGEHVFAFSREEPDEVMRALDASTGKVVWEARYPAPFKPNPAATRTHGTGPKSTPTFAAGRLYTLGMSGILSAFDAQTGKRLWQTPPSSVEPLYHTAMSPLVDRGLVILHVGGHDNGALTAFDAVTGDIKWRWAGDGPSYGSPVVAELGGTRQIITTTQKMLVGVSAATGELLWSRPFEVRATRNAITPVLYRNLVIVSGLGLNVTAFTVGQRDGKWMFEDAWENTETTMDMSTGVIIGDTLYGFSPRNRGQFFALDARTGKSLWLSEGRQAENAAVVRTGDIWIALEDDAELVVARASTAGFEQLKRYAVAESATWAQPVVSGSRIFIKDVSNVSLWTVK